MHKITRGVLIVGCLAAAFGIGGLLVRNWSTIENELTPSGDTTAAAKAVAQPTSGVIDIDDEVWRGPVIVDEDICKRMRVVGSLVTPNDTYWEIRLDHDDSRIYSLYPRNYPGDPTFKTQVANVIEWRIAKPNGVPQQHRTGSVAWQLVPKRQ